MGLRYVFMIDFTMIKEAAVCFDAHLPWDIAAATIIAKNQKLNEIIFRRRTHFRLFCICRMFSRSES